MSFISVLGDIGNAFIGAFEEAAKQQQAAKPKPRYFVTPVNDWLNTKFTVFRLDGISGEMAEIASYTTREEADELVAKLAGVL